MNESAITIPDRALILLPNWGKLIVSGNKLIEVRRQPIKTLGRAAIASQGYLIGECAFVDCIKMTKELFEKERLKHRIVCEYDDLPNNYKNGYMWIIKPGSAIQYNLPIKYNHPKGAIIWVRLDRPGVIS